MNNHTQCVDCGAPDVDWWRATYKAKPSAWATVRCRSCYNEACRRAVNMRRYGYVRPKHEATRGVGRTVVAKIPLSCVSCSSPFLAKRHDQRFCSEKCRYRLKSKLSKSQPPGVCPTCQGSFPRKRGAEGLAQVYCNRSCAPKQEALPKSSPLAFRECKQCSALMVDRVGRKYCSDVCRSANINARVMGFYNTAIANLDIPKAMMWRRKLVGYLADRDGVKCGICNCRIDVVLSSGPRGSDAGPSIDHVIPRSHGGSDDLSNLRLTHWSCNRRRGNRGGNEQLRLMG